MKFSQAVLQKISLSDDVLQNEVILILHHVNDCLKGLQENDLTYVEKGLKDIEEVANRLKDTLPKKLQNDVPEE